MQNDDELNQIENHWLGELSPLERQDVKKAFVSALALGTVQTGPKASITGNLLAVNNELKKMSNLWVQKLEVKGSRSDQKYTQMYRLVEHGTRYPDGHLKKPKSPTRCPGYSQGQSTMQEYKLRISPANPKYNKHLLEDHSIQATSTKKTKPFRDDKIMDDQHDPVRANEHQDYGDQQDLEDQDMQVIPQVKDFEEYPNNANQEFFDKEPQSDIVDKVVKTDRFTKVLKKRVRDPKNIPILVKAWKDHIKQAKRIEKALEKMGYKVKASPDLSSSEDEVEMNIIGKEFMQISAKSGMNQ